VRRRVGTCGWKVVALGETATMLAVAVVVTTAAVAVEKTRLPENNHNGTHTQRSLQFFFMTCVRCTAHTQH
jgi:hypothetical protein